MRANLSSPVAAKAKPRKLKRPMLKPGPSSSASGRRALLCEEHVLGVVLRPISELQPYTLNARSHPRAQLEKLAASIREFGFLIPILVDREDRIIAGHARAEAARLLGLAEVPTIAIHHLCDAQIRAFRIADNRLAELAQWDEQALAIELKALSALDLSFDVEITGFELAEIDILIERAEPGDDPDEADEIPELDETTPPVSEVGDLRLLGEHRLLCADALRPESYERLLEGETAHMVFTDPPYNVRINGHVGGAGKIKHAEFVMASGEMSEGEFTTFLTTVLSNLASQSADGALIYSCMDWRHGYELETAGRKAGLKLLNLCIWNKDNGGMGSFYRSKHELVFKHGSAPHINNIELGQYGRYRTNVWDYPGANTLRHGRLEELAMHPTVKPVALVADAIKDCTGRGHIVLDAFAGSGTTIIAAQKTGRVGCALELDPRYVDVAIKRWVRLSPKKAVHAETCLSFDELAAARRAAIEARCMKRTRARAAHGVSNRGR
jgi:DNA modification methylase